MSDTNSQAPEQPDYMWSEPVVTAITNCVATFIEGADDACTWHWVKRNLYEAQAAEIERLRAELADAREGATMTISKLIKRTQAYECSICGETDFEMGQMCSRDLCPKEHGEFTRQVWVRPYEKPDLALADQDG